jgi:glutamate decarboxylase
VPVHVDAASGGFIAPFLDPDLVWDFRIPRVVSIQTSGHKYGLVYPGVGWVLWQHKDYLPEELVFSVNYLGGEMPTFALNFSRPGSQVLLQYFMFLRLGFDGYRRIQQTCPDAIDEMDAYRLITRGDELPVFAFTLEDHVDTFTVFDVSNKLRERGWLVPAYTFPANRQDLAVMRIVCRNGFSQDLADMFLEDLTRSTEFLEDLSGPLPSIHSKPGFSH